MAFTWEEVQAFLKNNAKEFSEFLKDTGHILILKDFWIDCPSNVALSSALLIDVIKSGTSVAAPMLLSLAVNEMTQTDADGEKAKKYLLLWAGMLGGEHFLKAINNLIISYIQTRLSNTLIGDRLLKKFHKMRMETLAERFKAAETADLIIRSTEETNFLLSKTINEFAPLALNLIATACALYVRTPYFVAPILSTEATALLWGYSAYNLFICSAFSYFQRSVNEKTERKAIQFMGAFSEDLSHMPTIRIYNRSANYLEQTKALFSQFTDRILVNDAGPAWFKLILIKGAFFGACLATILFISGASLTQDKFDELVLVINYLVMFHLSTEAFGLNILDTRRAIRHLKQIKHIIASDSYEDEKTSEGYLTGDEIVAGNLKYSAPNIPLIKFENVSLTISGKQVLYDINFEIYPGKSCALVGESGSGKSSIIKLICGFYRPTTGKIFINGNDIETVHLDELRALITLINQDVQIFNEMSEPSLRLKYNVLFGHSTSESLKSTRLGNPISQQEEGVFTELSQQSLLQAVPQNLENPSTGEKQRIGLGRGLRTTPIVILDEPTSALDALSEETVIQKFNSFMQNNNGSVLLMTGHRLKTVQAADQILLIESGRIIERGTHIELSSSGGRYAQYYRAQTNTPSFSFFSPTAAADSSVVHVASANNPTSLFS